MVHGRQGLQPARLGGRDQVFAILAAGVAGGRGQPGQDLFGDLLGVALDGDVDLLGQADALGLDVDLDDLGVLRPVIHAVAGQGRERVQPGAQRQHHVGLGDQLHAGLGAVVAQGAGEQRVRAREGVVVLIAAAHRGGQALGKLLGGLDPARQHHTGAVQDDRELGGRQHLGGVGDGLLAARRAFQFDDLGQVDVDDLGPEIARHVDLRRAGAAPGFGDHAVQDLGDAGRVADFFLVADHVFEQGHLRDFLEPALADGLVGGLRRDQQHRGVVPIGGLDRGHEVGDAGAVLGHAHGHLAGRAREAVGHHAGVAFMGAVPEGDPRLGEQVRDRHHGRPDDAEGMFDAVHLEDLNEGLFRVHFGHAWDPPVSSLADRRLGPAWSVVPYVIAPLTRLARSAGHVHRPIFGAAVITAFHAVVGRPSEGQRIGPDGGFFTRQNAIIDT